MRLLHTVSAVSEEASGPSYSVVRLCESLIAQNQDVSLITLDWSPMCSNYSFLKQFPLGLGPKKLGRSPTMNQWLDQNVAKGKCNLIHNHGLWMMPNVYPGWAARKHHIPLMVSPRGTLSERAMKSGTIVKKFFWPLIQHPSLNAVSCFHATANSEYEDIRRMGFNQPVAVIPNGIDIPELPPTMEKDYRTLLFLGRIHPIKGLDMLLTAWQTIQCRFPEWRLRIVGPDNGGYLESMRRLASELELERIEFSGALLGEQKWQAYRDADLFVLPTHTENFGIVIAEALASGVPIITTHGTPWNGLLSHECGWWIKPTVEALTETLWVALEKDKPELQVMGMKGREYAREFDWQQIAQQTTDVYRWILGLGPRPDCVITD